jgi:hypothetical protein
VDPDVEYAVTWIARPFPARSGEFERSRGIGGGAVVEC